MHIRYVISIKDFYYQHLYNSFEKEIPYHG